MNKTVIVYTDNWKGTSYHLLKDNWKGTSYYLLNGDYSGEDGKTIHKTKLYNRDFAEELGLGADDMELDAVSYGKHNKVTPEIALSMILEGAKIACLRDDPFTTGYVRAFLKYNHSNDEVTREEGRKELAEYLRNY